MKTALTFTYQAIDGITQVFEALLWLISDYVLAPVIDFIKFVVTRYRNLILMVSLPLSMSMQDTVLEPLSITLVEQQIERSFQFDNTQTAFTTKMDLDKLKVFNYNDLREKLLKQVPYYLRSNMDRYLEIALTMSEKYQIDPFWVLAIMKTESHFNTNAVSHVGARGLMQVMPKTSEYIAKRLMHINYGPFTENEFKEFTRPEVNIEMGVYYMGYLLKKFRYNPYYATMAYNMGPNRLRRKLRSGQGRYLKKRNNYLRKVKENYFELIKPFRSALTNG